jgi:hypothetical protein
MTINSLSYRSYNELADGFKTKGGPREDVRWREDIKDTLQQHGITITTQQDKLEQKSSKHIDTR